MSSESPDHWVYVVTDIEVDAYRCSRDDRLLIVKRGTPKDEVLRLAGSLELQLSTGLPERRPVRVDVDVLLGKEYDLAVWSSRWGSY